MEKRVNQVLLLLVSLCFFCVVSADDNAYFSVENNQSKIGEPVQLHLHIKVPSASQLFLPNFIDVLQPLEVTRVGSPNLVNQPTDGFSEYDLPITVIAWEVGEINTPSVEMSYKSGVEPEVKLVISPVKINFLGTLTTKDMNLRPLKPQLERLYIPLWIKVLSIVAFVVVICLFGLRVWSRNSIVHSKDLGTQEHLQLLEMLAASPESPDLTHFRISEILRAYLQFRYKIPVYGLTTFEILSELRKISSLTNDDLQRLSELLRRGDIAKYANILPTERSAAQYASSAANWIQSVNVQIKERAI